MIRLQRVKRYHHLYIKEIFKVINNNEKHFAVSIIEYANHPISEQAPEKYDMPDNIMNIIEATNLMVVANNEGHNQAIEAYVKAVFNSTLDDQKKFDLLLAKDSDGDPSIRMAFQNGHHQVVEAYVKAVLNSTLDDQKRFDLLLAKISNGGPSIRMAYRELSKLTQLLQFVNDNIDRQSISNTRYTYQLQYKGHTYSVPWSLMQAYDPKVLNDYNAGRILQGLKEDLGKENAAEIISQKLRAPMYGNLWNNTYGVTDQYLNGLMDLDQLNKVIMTYDEKKEVDVKTILHSKLDDQQKFNLLFNGNPSIRMAYRELSKLTQLLQFVNSNIDQQYLNNTRYTYRLQYNGNTYRVPWSLMQAYGPRKFGSYDKGKVLQGLKEDLGNKNAAEIISQKLRAPMYGTFWNNISGVTNHYLNSLVNSIQPNKVVMTENEFSLFNSKKELNNNEFNKFLG